MPENNYTDGCGAVSEECCEDCGALLIYSEFGEAERWDCFECGWEHVHGDC